MPSTSLILTLTIVALHSTLTAAVPVDNFGNAYTGDGGHASGGDVHTHSMGGPLGSFLPGGFVDILDGNAGDGGIASSGNAIGGLGIGGLNPKWQGIWPLGGGRSDNTGNAYTGNGGEANGGSVHGPKALLNILSHNAGDGGDAGSGTAIGAGDFGGGDFGAGDISGGRDHFSDRDDLSDHDRDQSDDDRHHSDEDRHHDDEVRQHGDEDHRHDDRHTHRGDDCDC